MKLPSSRRQLSGFGAALCASALALSFTSWASAADERPRAEPERAPPSPEQARGWKRPPGTPPEQVALFIPRLVLMLPNLALTIAFLPIRQALGVVSRNVRVNDDDPTNDEGGPTVTVLPHVSYLSGFGGTLGVAARLQNLGGFGEEAALTAGYGGIYAPFVEVSAVADSVAGAPAWLESRTRYEIRPQELFCGIGDRRPCVESRFREERLTVREGGGVTFGEPGRLFKVGGTAIFERSHFGPKDDAFARERSIESAYDTSTLPGFESGLKTLELQCNFSVDTRDAPAAPTRGIHAVAFAGGVPDLTGYGFGHVGLDTTVYFNVYRVGRVLALRAAVEGVFAERGQIPFTRLAQLGGTERLRGYAPARYRDREAALVSAEYSYPIHRVVAGALFVDAGHVAAEPSGLLAWRRWRPSAGIGLRVRTSSATIASLDLAYGDGPRLFLTVFPFDSPAPGDRP